MPRNFEKVSLRGGKLYFEKSEVPKTSPRFSRTLIPTYSLTTGSFYRHGYNTLKKSFHGQPVIVVLFSQRMNFTPYQMSFGSKMILSDFASYHEKQRLICLNRLLAEEAHLIFSRFWFDLIKSKLVHFSMT